MGGADDLPKRASSPLKRPASDLSSEDTPSQKEDVDMVMVPASDSAESARERSPLLRRDRAQSVDMLGDDTAASPAPVTKAPRSFSPTSEIPPIDAQIKTVTTMIEAAAQKQPADGDKVLLVSKRWLNKVTSRGTDARQHNKEEPEGEIGPIDNSDIIQQIITDYEGVNFVQLKPGTGSDQFELFPEDVWDIVMEWYGLMPGSHRIERFAHNTNPDKSGIPNVQFEFHPLILKVHRLVSDVSTIPIPQVLKARNPPAPIFVVSRSTRYVDFLRKAKIATQIDIPSKVKVWRVPRLLPAAEITAAVGSIETPPTSRPGTPAPPISAPAQRAPQDTWTQVLLDVVSFTKLEKGLGRDLIEGQDVSANANYNGQSDLGHYGIGDDESIVLDEQVNSRDCVSTFSAKSATSTAIARLGASASQPNSGRTSPALSGPITRGRTQKSGRVKGTVGLTNLGNTCYMNSALQCVRSVEELTKYFLSGSAEHEINYDNILGWGGEVANAYKRLLQEVYKDQVPTSVAPRAFKNTIGKFAPSFSGYGQQDSQEFLGFLLDGLQEDLSRIKKKPYIEKPDSTDEMINNPEAIREMAAKVWDITKQRDDSVIADLFTGMYKSTVVCPECDKVSITFDPFNNVTLQLPIENNWTHNVLYYPLNDKPIIINVDISKQASILALKQFISARVGVPPERLFAAEEFKGKFFKIYANSSVVSEEINTNDHCVVHEIEAKPSNWPARKVQKKKSSFINDSEDDIPTWEDPVAEKMLLPVFHRRPGNGDKISRLSTRKTWALAAVPHFIVVTPEEARSPDALKRKVLEKVASLSTWAELHEDEESPSSGAGSLIVTNGSDADSSGSTKVIADSVDGDDDLVNVSKQPNDGQEKSHTSHSFPTFNTRRPKFIDPKEYLNPAAAGLFDLRYLPAGKEMIPTGWNYIDEDKVYPSILSRMPKTAAVNDASSIESSPGFGQRQGSESSQDDDMQNSGGAPTRMAEESDASDEDDLPPPIRQRALPVRLAAPSNSVVRASGKRKNSKRPLKTYSKKHQQAVHRKQQQEAPESEDDMEVDPGDDGPLIRLGEAIVVDWLEGAYETVYHGDTEDTLRGQNHFDNIPTMEDPELKARKTARALRRKNGITLDDCLAEFGKEEILSEHDMWYCPRCKEHRRASKKFELWKTPDVLIMHLKRFSSSGYRRDKLDVMVDFPMEGLDLSSRVLEVEDGKTMTYDLFAVDDHWGGLGGGHYTAFAKNYEDNEWYEYNDSSVSKVRDPTRVVSQSAYLLFYRRRSDEPLGGPRLQQIITDYNRSQLSEASSEEDDESGEDRGLGGTSSQLGSSSPFKGAGAIRPQKGGLGASKLKSLATISPSSIEQLPAYSAHESNPDAAPTLARDAVMNDALHESIEEDEGINMDSPMGSNYGTQGYSNSSHNPIGPQTWGWQAVNTDNDPSSVPTYSGLDALTGHNRKLVSGTGSEADEDLASDIVDDNSSASSGSRRGRLADFDEAGDDGFVDPSIVPDMDDDAIASDVALRHEMYEQREFGPIQQVRAVGTDEDLDLDDAPAAEIHIEDVDELK